MSETLVTITLEAVTCGECGLTFGLEAEYRRQLRYSHQTFYCPNGHARVYRGETEADKLRRELEMSRSNATWQRAQREAAERSRAALKGQVTRIKRKVAAGQCPCCRTTFSDLAGHMADQHPEFADA